MTTITLPRTRAPVDLKHATPDELWTAYDTGTDQLRAAILGELQTRDDAAKRRRARHTDPVAAEWRDGAHAQWLDAERECRGRLLNDAGMHAGIDPWSLWGGPWRLAERWMSEELRNYWLDHPRVTVTAYRDAERRARHIYTDQIERADHDRLAVHEQGEVRPGSMGPGVYGSDQESTRPHVSADDPLPGPGPADPGSVGGTRDNGHVPTRANGGPGMTTPDETTAQERRAQRAEDLAGIRQRSAEIGQRIGRPASPPAQPSYADTSEPDAGGCVMPAAPHSTAQGRIAVRQTTAVVQARPRIDGAQTLWYIYKYLEHFAVWGSEAEIVAATLWIAHTYARDSKSQPVWQYCARLAVAGPSGAGKSWKTRLIGKLACSGEIIVEATKPAFIDLCAENNTVIVTEADEAFRTPGRCRGIVAVINASYEPDRKTSRKQGGVAVKIPLFCHAVLDGIDEVLLSPNRPDLKPMMSRCIVLLAQPAPEDYRPPRFDRQARATAELLGRRTAAWITQEVQDDMADDVPDVPKHLGNRPFGKWEPLFTVALRADKGDPEGTWSRACADACEQLVAVGIPVVEETDDSMSELDRQMAAYGAGDDL